MEFGIVSIVVGAFLVLLSYEAREHRINWTSLGAGLAFICTAPFSNHLVKGMLATQSMYQFLLSVGAIILGFFLMQCMGNAIATTEPESTSLTEFVFYGFFKWDDFAEYWIVGAFMVLGGLLFGFLAVSSALSYYDRVPVSVPDTVTVTAKAQHKVSARPKVTKAQQKVRHRQATRAKPVN